MRHGEGKVFVCSSITTCARVETNQCATTHQRFQQGFCWFKKFVSFSFHHSSSLISMAAAFRALTCRVFGEETLSLSPELAELYNAPVALPGRPWVRQMGSWGNRTFLVCFFGLECRKGPLKGRRGRRGYPTPLRAVNYLLTSLLICASAAGGAKLRQSESADFASSLVQFDPGPLGT